jgi:hypothetical protein
MQERSIEEDDRRMSDDFDKVVEEMQASIIEEARKVYSEKVMRGGFTPHIWER